MTATFPQGVGVSIAPAKPLEDVTEKEWQSQLVALAKTLGWKRIYHTHDSRRSQPGFPDLVCLRERVVHLEVKSERGKLSAAQREWLAALVKAGAEVYVVRPRHLELIGRVLACRWPETTGWGWPPLNFCHDLADELRGELG